MEVKSQHISASKLARILKVDSKSIWQYIKREKIKAIEVKKIYNTWYLIPIEEAKRIIKLTRAYRRGRKMIS
jgi:biotin operon repressor